MFFLFFSTFDLTFFFPWVAPKKHAIHRFPVYDLNLSNLSSLIIVQQFNMKIEVGNRAIYKLNYDVFPTNNGFLAFGQLNSLQKLGFFVNPPRVISRAAGHA